MVANDQPSGTLRYGEKPVYTTSNGCPINDPESSQRVGQNGPLLLQDFHLIDLLAHFDRERIPERVVHAKGAGAYGDFEVTHDVSDLVSGPPLPNWTCWRRADRQLRRRWTCSMVSARRPSWWPASLPLVARRAPRTLRETLAASL